MSAAGVLRGLYCWDDATIGIGWPAGLQHRLAAKDAEAPLLADADTF